MMSEKLPSRKRSRFTYGIFAYAAMALIGFVALLPFLWMLSTSLKSNSGIFRYPPEWIPNPVMWSNYVNIMTNTQMPLAILNSLKIALINTGGALLTCSMAAYAFAKLEFRGKNKLFMVLISTMMIPMQVTLIPMFILFRNFGWIDTHLPLIVPSLLSNAYGVFLLRQFYMTLPTSLMESAKIDGASQPYIFFRIMMPLSIPAMATFGLVTFMGNWNNFMTPLIYLSSRDKYTVPLMVATLQGQYTAQWNTLMAGSCIALIPVIILYVFTQRYFVEGIVLTGMKS